MAALLLGTILAGTDSARATEPADALAIARDLARADGPHGQAERAARADRLAGLPAPCVLPCLVVLGEATPTGANWLRAGLERAAERLGPELAPEQLARFVADTSQPARGRSLAHSWLRKRDAGMADRLLDALREDPALDLRRAAVDRWLASAEGRDVATATTIHRGALAAARDVDQVERIAQWLAEHGEPVDVAAVLGFVRRWRVSGTFDNRGGTGFAAVHPPETAEADGAGWKEVVSTDRLGMVDLNAAVAREKGVLAYAVADVRMPGAGPAEVRIGSPCAVKVWVNGAEVMAHEIYHASEAVDQYVAAARFRAGANSILVKCCQNEQTEPWAGDWRFQLRVCDPLGTPRATQDELPR